MADNCLFSAIYVRVNPGNCKIYETHIWGRETFVHSYNLGSIYLINKVLQFVSLFAQNSCEFCRLNLN